MTKSTINEVLQIFADEAKKLYGIKLREIVLYGSCARGDFMQDSDIDILVLLDVPQEEISNERKRMLETADRLDLDYDVVLAPVFLNDALYRQYLPVSVFYQNIQREGVKIA